MINIEKKKINKIEKLVEVIASNVLKLTTKVDKIDKDVSVLKTDVAETKVDIKAIRNDIFNLADRFPSRFALDELSSRVYNLEKKRK